MFFKMNTRDYSKMPINLFSQIWPLFTAAWGLIALVFVPVADVLNKFISKIGCDAC